MTFEALVDAVDARVRNGSLINYGIFRGPHVAFWQWGPIAARLREGKGEDIEFVLIDGNEDARIILERSTLTAERIADTILTAWSHT
jgi:hypothetical protein